MSHTTAHTIGATTSSVSFATAFAVSGELQIAITILSILIMIDFLTGVIKSWIHKTTTSEGIARGFLRKTTLVIIPLTLLILGKGVHIDLTAITTWIISALAFSEAYSIIANVYEINTKKKAKEYDVLTIIIKKFGVVIDSFLTEKTNEKHDK